MVQVQKAPDNAHRNGVSVMQVADMFATEHDAIEWFETWMWPDGEMCCRRCGSVEGAYRVPSGRPQPYRCRDCRLYFSLKTGTAMQDSKLPLRLWTWAIYLEMTSVKGVSSIKLCRYLGVTQKTAWFMLHRIREAFADIAPIFEGQVDVDETYIGTLERNEHERGNQRASRGTAGNAAVVGTKHRTRKQVVARVVERTNRGTLQDYNTAPEPTP